MRKTTDNPIEYVDPFVGVDGFGNCLCGPYLPHSLVRVGPDTIYPQKTNGYSSDKPIIRFTNTHVSGTGGGGRYGNIGITPFTGQPRLFADGYQRANEHATCGYYTVHLMPNNIQVNLTSTPRVGIHQYTFPTDQLANILIDVGAVIQTGPDVPKQELAISTGGFVEITSSQEIIGRGDFRGGWGHRYPYSVYFCAIFDKPMKKGLVANHGGVLTSENVADGPSCKAILHFGDTKDVGIKVGVSFVSIAKARASVENETSELTFQDITNQSKATWNNALSRIKVTGGTDKQKTLFYTLFTRLLCMPTDLGIDDENPLWQSGIRNFSDFFCLWDSVRNANSLITLFDPELEVDMLNCLLDIADHIGWIPDAWISGHSSQIQGGSSADILFCEAAQKGIKGIDYEKALRHMRKNNETESPDPKFFGRHLGDYHRYDYLSTNVPKNCVSRHLEYTYQDWCIGALAEHLDQQKLADKYYRSSQRIWNLWDIDRKCFAPKTPTGHWAEPFDPILCRQPDSWNDPYFYEGSSIQWSLCVHHDYAGLIERHGGKEAFIKHLDRFFDEGHYLHKEFMLHASYLYIYAGRPDLTAQRVAECLKTYYDIKRDGLTDNEDMGCQSAWYMCSAMGLYPIMGQDLYLLTTPIFTRIEIELGQSGNQFIIEAPGADKGLPYIASAKLNGQPINRAWLSHHEICHGATLALKLSATPTDWAKGDAIPCPLAKSRKAATLDLHTPNKRYTAQIAPSPRLAVKSD